MLLTVSIFYQLTDAKRKLTMALASLLHRKNFSYEVEICLASDRLTGVGVYYLF